MRPTLIITVLAACFVNIIFAMESYKEPCHIIEADVRERGNRMRILVNDFVETLSEFVTTPEIDISSFQMSISTLHEQFSQIVCLGEGLLQSGENYDLIESASNLFQAVSEFVANKSKYDQTGDTYDKLLCDAQELYLRCLVLKHARKKSGMTRDDLLIKSSELTFAFEQLKEHRAVLSDVPLLTRIKLSYIFTEIQLTLRALEKPKEKTRLV
ncbi:hypothetical protein OXX79_006699 [Metschnikowia pulcherrima]